MQRGILPLLPTKGGEEGRFYLDSAHGKLPTPSNFPRAAAGLRHSMCLAAFCMFPLCRHLRRDLSRRVHGSTKVATKVATKGVGCVGAKHIPDRAAFCMFPLCRHLRRDLSRRVRGSTKVATKVATKGVRCRGR